jgi:class 3 adenylate cyclase
MNERLRKLFRPYVGKGALEHLADERAGEEIVCLVARVQNFDSLLRERDLPGFALLMNQFYVAVAEAVTRTEGDIDRFCGSTVVVNYWDDLNRADLALIDAFRDVHDSLEADFGLRIGVGICAGTVIVGRFGAPDRFTHTAFGAPIVCADRLADEERTLAMCERVPPLIRSSDSLLDGVPYIRIGILSCTPRDIEDSVELFWTNGAGDRFRTDDLVLGKHALYQLSYTRSPKR